MGYYNDINVSITNEFAVQVGLINRILLITGEEDVKSKTNGFLKLSGASAKKELQTWLTTNTKTAPLLLKAVELATTQTDNSGNAIIPDYVYVVGAKIANFGAATDVSTLTTLIEKNTQVESDFWAIVPTDYNTKLVEWAVGFCNSKGKGFLFDVESKTFAMNDLKKSARLFAVYNGKTGDQLDQQFAPAIAGRCIAPASLTGFKFKTVTGITGYEQGTLTNAEVTTLATNGVNTYLKRYSKSSLDGSFTTDSDGNQKAVNHIDQMFIRDNIKYNLIKNIYLWLNNSEMASMNDYPELEAVVNTVLNEFVDLGFIEVDPLTGVKQFIVDVPVPSKQDRQERLINGTFSYMPTGAIEWVTITGKEVFDTIGGEE